MSRRHAVNYVERGGVMSERTKSSARTALCRAIGVLLLAATAAACDKCGDFVWNKPGACRDYGPPQR